MIQRIQTVYLLLAAVLMAMTCVFPVAWLMQSDSSFYNINALGVQAYDMEAYSLDLGGIALMVATAIATIVPFAAIFGFNNRCRQMRWVVYAILLMIVQAALLAVNIYFLMESFPTLRLVPNIGAILPLCSIIFSILAHRAIKRDDDKIRSIDRIR